MKELSPGIRILLITVGILFFMLSCADDNLTDKSRVLARINGEQLTEDMLAELANVADIDDLSGQQIRNWTEDLIKITLLAQQADNNGLTDNPRVNSRIRLAEKSIKANLFLSSMFQDMSPSETELFDYYQIHKGRYQQDRDEYRVQRIKFADEAVADSVSNMIIDNEISFTEAARLFSQEEAQSTDGFMGYLTFDEMEDFIRRAVTNLSQWRYMKVTGDGAFFLVRYTDRRNRSADKSFTDVIDEIRKEYIADKKQQHIDNEIKLLIDKADIEILR